MLGLVSDGETISTNNNGFNDDILGLLGEDSLPKECFKELSVLESDFDDDKDGVPASLSLSGFVAITKNAHYKQ